MARFVFTVGLPLDVAYMLEARNGRAAWQRVHNAVVVEDQADARLMMQLLLESSGISVVTAENGRDGAAIIEQMCPDLALVDLGLPVMSGFDVARQIRQNASAIRTRLVALSGYGQDSDAQAALEAGFDEHLTKPPDMERLEQILRGEAG